MSIGVPVEFADEWISVSTLHELARLVESVEDVPGAIMEFGCWEGRSLVWIANAAGDRPVHAVDHWRGNIGDDYTQAAVQSRDVYGQFLINTAHLSNVRVHRSSTEDFMVTWNAPIAFLHIDADHDYQPVKDQIVWALERLAPGGVLCGDDYSQRWEGVMKAVDELLPDREVFGCMWVHRND
jgi:predicted O-methyltransferase YrrM